MRGFHGSGVGLGVKFGDLRFGAEKDSSITQRVLSISMVECRVAIVGITLVIWEGIPHSST